MNRLSWEQVQPFWEAIETWYQGLPTVRLEEVVQDPDRVALFCVDLTNAFAYEGTLASPRVTALVPPIVNLFQRAYALGVRHFLLPQDTHDPDAVEFGAFAPHAVAGTSEAEMVPELRALPFADRFEVFPKNSINSFVETDLGAWMEDHPQVDTCIVVGDCTDLCVYQLAMHLRVQANARGLQRRVIVPADAVDTYHLSVETARTLGILPHHGDLLHRIFLYHMALNGIEVVATLS